ncbi:MAG: hypothetical protein J6T90_00650, partial [Methanomicrobium sp.]|nr:hypothetical protein [Methanomicrobium sp.]
MKSKAGIACDTAGFMNKYIEDCGVTCELVSPQMLATPFYKGNIVALVIPTGFGNRMYSGILPALRASADRIEKFVKKGGRVLCFGAMTADGNTYGWLPFKCSYVHDYFNAPITVDKNNEFSGITADFDESGIEFDCYFDDDTAPECEVIASTKDGKKVMIAKKHGEGYYVITSIHELPSKEFI